MSVHSSIATILDTLENFTETTASSVTEAARRAIITGNAFVERSVAENDIAISLMGALNQMYAGYVLVALNLHQYVDSTRTVGDLMRSIATEGFDDLQDLADSLNVEIANEAAGSTVLDMEPTSTKLAVGRVIDTEFSIPGKNGNEKLHISFMVQLQPYLISTEVLDYFIENNASTPWSFRFKEARHGHISFFLDFIGQLDRIKKFDKAIRTDASGALEKMSSIKNNAIFNHWMGLLKLRRQSNNLASSVIVADSRSFEMSCAKSGMDFNNVAHRNKFFTSTMSIFVAVVNFDYNTVDLYISGRALPVTMSFSWLKTAGSNRSALDLKDLVMKLGAASAIKF